MDSSRQPGSRLVLMRHAKSDYPWGVDDHDRPLNDRGRRDAPALGTWLDGHVTWEDGAATRVLVSTARRAQLTWGLARAQLSGRWDEVDVLDEPRIYEASVASLKDVIAEVPAGTRTLVMVGHNPGLVELIMMLARPDELRAEATAKFPTSAVAVLTSDLQLTDAVAQSHAFRVAEFAVPRG
jgi:phosphohistidine phosphatase